MWIARRRTMAYELVLRARLILRLGIDPCVAAAAVALGVTSKLVRRWRDRFLGRKHDRVDALRDLPRSGRPREIDAVTRCEVMAMACGKPADFGVPCRQIWTLSTLAETYRSQHSERRTPSRTLVHRILSRAEIRPHRLKMWLHSPDPKFREKVTEICELYLNPPEGSVVICIDEKTGMQALGRKHPVRLVGPGRSRRMDHEYVRNGTRKLLAAFNPKTGEVYAEVRANRKAADLVEFMDNLARQLPKLPVHVIWDNLNIHFDGAEDRWTLFNARHGGRFHFHYTPIHASWVNQVEQFFGILQRRVLRYGVFDSLEELDDAIVAFIDHWNRVERHPIRWTFRGYPIPAASAA